MSKNKWVLYTSFYRDGDCEYREPGVEQAPADKDLDEWATEQEDTFGTRDEEGQVWDGNRIYEVHDPKEITNAERELLSKLSVA